MSRGFTWWDGLRWTATEEGAELVFRGAGHHTLPLEVLPRPLADRSDGSLRRALGMARARERAAVMAARELPVIEPGVRRRHREPLPAAAEPEYQVDPLWGL